MRQINDDYYIGFAVRSKISTMKKIALMLILIAAGIVIVALPDKGKRIFSISKDHGPSLQDAMGLVMVLIGYGWFLIQAWTQRRKILQYKNRLSFKLIAPL